LTFGANYRRWKLNRDLAADFLGDFTFNGSFTGNPVADFLLGYFSGAAAFQPSAFSDPQRAGNARQYNFQYIAPYIQDDWKVSGRLTLNLGARWDYRTAPYETNDHFGWRDPSNPRGGMLVADRDSGRCRHHRRRQLLQVCGATKSGGCTEDGLCSAFRLRLSPV
jgi:outer membrane receptor protein involved in Fe transport